MKLKHNIIMFYGLIMVMLMYSPASCSNAEQGLDDEAIFFTGSSNCTKCGCSNVYIYDEVNNKCVVNFGILKRVVVHYNKHDVQFLPGDELAKSIYMEGEKLFKGIMIAVFLFMTCASVCIVTACIYCCRINYTDRELKNDVKALAKKLKRNYDSKKYSKKQLPLPPASESCNVICEDAGVLVV